MRAERETSLIAERRVRLAPGRHASPREGACVVELASLIAREPFSDEPRCVCPVIASFLRAWNDRAGYAERQRLRPYAARIVGTRADWRIASERRDLCLEWVGADLRGGRIRRGLSRLAMRFKIALYCGFPEALLMSRGAGEYAARVLFSRRDSAAAFVLLDAMLALGGEALVPTERRPDSNYAKDEWPPPALIGTVLPAPGPSLATGARFESDDPIENGSQEGEETAEEAVREPVMA